MAAYFLLWRRPAALPLPGSPLYEEYLRAFQVGVAALDTTQEDLARSKLDRAIKLIPQEPAAWANRGLLHLRKNNLEEAAKDLLHANKLAPESGEIEGLLGLLAERQGRLPEAVAHLRKAAEKDPHDLALLFTLAETTSQEGGPDSEAEYQRLMEQILKDQPNNLPVLVERARAAFQRKDMGAFRATLDRFARLASGWTPDSQKALAKLQKATEKTPGDIVFLLPMLKNFLQAERGFSRDSQAIRPRPGFVGATVQEFLRLEKPAPSPAPPDRELAFTKSPWAPPRPAPALEKSKWNVLQVAWLIGKDQADALIRDANANFGGVKARAADTFTLGVFLANAKEVRRADAKGNPIPFPGGAKAIAPSSAGIVPLDWNNDFRTNLVLAGAGGLRFWQQQADGSFSDVSAKTGLAADILGGDYYGVWAADIDMDGDLDLIVARRSGSPLILRNNRDGTFTAREAFESVRGARSFVWADLDNDGAQDAAFLDADGKLHVYANERAGQFSAWPLPKDLGTILALAAADVNDDGVFDLVALKADGALVRISDQDKRKAWQVADLARLPGAAKMAPGSVTLFAEDLDNNGAVDLIVAGPEQAHIFLANEKGKLESLADAVPMRVLAVVDLNGDGRLDLLGLSADGQPVQAINRGGKAYRWQVIWPLANVKAEGDNRINSFNIGGEVEMRSGALVQKQLVRSPAVHFGLGEQKDVNVARIVWTNGVGQLEFELPKDHILAAEQRLSGSCPFLFTFDGKGMRFIGDFMWGTPLGMYVNGQNIGGFPQTTEWLKITGDQLVPRDGYYDVRVHANLWETDYFDQLALIVVDHPSGTEIYVDEHFPLTGPPRLHVTTPAKPVAKAWDHHGKEVTDLVRAIDGRYLDRAGRSRFQGLTNDHWVEVDLGDDAPKKGPLYLVARGWIHPTDSSINVAIEQGKHDRPFGLVLEVPDGKGGWKAGRDKLGFPAGRNKNMLIRMDGIEGAGVSRRFRLRTNMEIYWDFLGYVSELDSNQAKLHRPAPQIAELRYRGHLEVTQKDKSTPERAHYDKVSHGQKWRDLTGFYTRFGDVRELLNKRDDRYVIMNAGDEIAFRFPVPDGPPAGWKRDFIWESDGWTRDGNQNTRFGTTVLPLPAHELSNERPPGLLTDDPVFQLCPEDWRTFHTRYVTDFEFARGLRTFRRPFKNK